jgi:hypothetical protein
VKEQRCGDYKISDRQRAGRGTRAGSERNRTVGPRAGQLPSVMCLAYVRAGSGSSNFAPAKSGPRLGLYPPHNSNPMTLLLLVLLPDALFWREETCPLWRQNRTTRSTSTTQLAPKQYHTFTFSFSLLAAAPTLSPFSHTFTFLFASHGALFLPI